MEENEYGLKIRRKKPICCACNVIFFSKEALEAHTRAAHPKPTTIRENSCSRCYLCFESALILKKHLSKLKWENSVYEYCKLCDQIIYWPKDLGGHLCRIHFAGEKRDEIERCFSCEMFCEANVTNEFREGSRYSFPCSNCGREFDCAEKLERHNELKEFVCRLGDCTYKTLNKKDMVQHCIMAPHNDTSVVATDRRIPYETLNELFEVMPADPDSPTCKVRRKGPMCCGCDLFFLQDSELADHKSSTHAENVDDRTWVCELCLSAFGSNEQLLLHNHRRDEDVYEYCMNCQLVLTQDSYDQHEIKYHPMTEEMEHRLLTSFSMHRETRHKCCVVECRNRYDTNAQLLEHCNSTHCIDATDQNTCSYCGTIFETTGDLTKHRDRQYEIIRFSCKSDECKFTTYSRVEMLKHGSHRTHKCDLMCILSDKMVKEDSLDELIDIYKSNGMLCCGCNMMCNSAEDLRQHQLDSHSINEDNLPFRCTSCKRGFSREAFLVTHLEKETIQTNYYCRVCKILMKNLRQVTHHKLYIHSFLEPSDPKQYYDKITYEHFPCCGCDQQFPTMDELAEHCSQSHPVRSNHYYKNVCVHCNQDFMKKKLVIHHNPIYGNKIRYRCKIGKCDRQYTSLVDIENHVCTVPHDNYYMKSGTEAKYCCVYPCNFNSTCYETLIEHSIEEHVEFREEQHRKSKDKLFPCPVCCRGYDTDFQLINHQRRRPDSKCPVCKKAVNRTDLADHLETCKATNRQTCAQCDAEFTYIKDLRKHKRIVHGVRSTPAPSRVICNICGKQVTTGRIKGHMESHANKREFACPKCPLRFNSKQMLKLHEKRHNPGKEFVCRKGCENRYRNPGDRNRHEKIVHTRDLPFKCTLCTDAFVRDRDLRLHMRKHTGRKLYSCEDCGADFDKLSEMAEHREECPGRMLPDEEN